MKYNIYEKLILLFTQILDNSTMGDRYIINIKQKEQDEKFL